MASPYPTPDAIRKASIKAYHVWGEILLERFHGRQLPGPVAQPGAQVPLPETVKAQELKVKTPIKRLAIVGAGVAGLYTAMLLREHGHEFEIHIYEANDRIGGRLYTHHFNKKSAIGTPSPGGEFDYFDVGAMRFPDTPIMAKTFDLFKMLKVPRLDYNISDESNWLAYNGVRKTKAEIKKNPGIWAEDPFKVSKKNGGTVPDKWARQDPSDLLHDALKDLIKEIVDNPKKGLQKVIDQYDHFSTRSFLASKGFPPAVITWIETMAYGTGWFDRGLIETILEQMAFMYDKDASTDLDWYCVKGGSEVLPLKMVEWLKTNSKSTHIHLRNRVTKVDYKQHHELVVSGISHPLVTGDASFFKETFSHVVFAIPPPCLRMINLDNCELDYAQRTAMRSLQLAPSSKIGMKFKTAWWQGVNNNHVGGQSTTDRTARTIVYPSHGDGASTVLIVSYAWTQDSLALAAMMHGPGSAEEERLKQIMLEDLAYVHKKPMRELADEFEYMFAFDWSSNPLSMGAFGLFGPSQFREFYRHVTRPAARGQIYFVGETFSTTHGWVAGALNSAARGVCQLLQHHRLATHNKGHEEDYIEKFLQKWKPDLEVTKEALLKQLITSLVLQHEEFDKEKA